MLNLLRTLLLCLPAVTLAAQALPAASVSVPAGGDLQAAIDQALPGETIELEAGATYVGHFRLPPWVGPGARPIVIRTAGPDAVPAGVRISPADAPRLAKLRSPDGSPVLATRPGARYWTIQLVEFEANQGGANDIIALGDGSPSGQTAGTVPSDILLDRVYIHGDPQAGQKRGIALNSSRTTIRNSWISDIKAVGQDSQAIAGWNGPGGYVIENNYLEGAGENILFGGADPSIIDLTPTDIVIRGNTIAKPLAWKTEAQPWQVKNLLELKNARAVRIESNLFERSWAQAQAGHAILFTVRNQDGRCPWCKVEDVRFESNVVRSVAGGIVILGTDYINRSGLTSNIVVRNNLFDGIDAREWGGDGFLLQMTDGPRDIVVDRNTIIQRESGGIVKVDGVVEGFAFTNNVTAHGLYGIIASSRAPGNSSIRASLPGSKIAGNVIAEGDSFIYPPDNFFPSNEELWRQFVDPSKQDYRLKPNNPWARRAKDARGLGTALGAPSR